VLARAALVLGIRTFGDAVPFAGPLFADLFTAHKWAAKMIVQAIDEKLGEPVKATRGPRWAGRGSVAA
jgi:hypothetical protein